MVPKQAKLPQRGNFGVSGGKLGSQIGRLTLLEH